LPNYVDNRVASAVGVSLRVSQFGERVRQMLVCLAPGAAFAAAGPDHQLMIRS
jgi:hypothetical protein